MCFTSTAMLLAYFDWSERYAACESWPSVESAKMATYSPSHGAQET